ncbi:MAG: hypothetical protein ACTSVI_07720 [Promethearchaeota archaeon]
MSQYFFKISILPVTSSKKNQDIMFSKLFSKMECVEDWSESGNVDIRASMFQMPGDITVNAEFWLIDSFFNVKIEDALHGSDGVILIADQDNIENYNLLTEYISLIDENFQHMPVLVLGINVSAPISIYDFALARMLWKSHVVEYSSLNLSDLNAFENIIMAVMRAAIEIREAGPIIHEIAWIRTHELWKIMRKKIESESIDNKDKIFLGRNFLVLSIIAREKGKIESQVLGSISSRWFELADEYLLASRVAELLKDDIRTDILKKKHLNQLMNEGNKLLRFRQFKEAAQKFEAAAYWNRSQALALEKGDMIFKKAIDAWISALEFDKVNDLLMQASRPISVLLDIKDKIYRGIEFLVKRNLLEKANKQLSIIINTFMRHDLKEDAIKLVEKSITIKIELFKEKLEQHFIGDSVQLIEDLIDVKDQFDLNVEIPDEPLSRLLIFLIENENVHEYEKLLPLIKDKEVIKKLEAIRSSKEVEREQERKKKIDLLKKSAYERLLVYYHEEQEDALKYAKKRRKILYQMIEQGKPDRAFHFMTINVNWLKDIGKDNIASDLAYQVLKYLVRYDFKFYFSEINSLVQEENLKKLVKNIIQHVNEIVKLDKEDLFLSEFIHHYYDQFLKHNFFESAVLLRRALIDRLIFEVNLLFNELTEDSIELIKEKLNDIKNLLNMIKNGDKKESIKKHEQLTEKLLEYYSEKKDMINMSRLINELSDLEIKKKYTIKLNRIQNEIKLSSAGEGKRQELIDKFEEELKEYNRLLLTREQDRKKLKMERLNFLEDLVAKGDIPEQLPVTIKDVNKLKNRINTLTNNQEKALDYFIKKRFLREACLSLVVLSLLYLKRNTFQDITTMLEKINNLPEYIKDKIKNEVEFKLILLLNQAIKAEIGHAIIDVIKQMALLPLLRGEYALIFLVQGKDVPMTIFKVERKDELQDFKQYANEMIPSLLDLASMELEPILPTLIMKRRLLEKENKIAGLSCLRDEAIAKAALYYQDESYNFFEKGEIILGWTSLWISILALLKNNKDIDSVMKVFKNFVNSSSDDVKTKDHVIGKTINFFLACFDKKLFDLCLDFISFHEILPLLEEEKNTLNFEDIIYHFKKNRVNEKKL